MNCLYYLVGAGTLIAYTLRGEASARSGAQMISITILVVGLMLAEAIRKHGKGDK